MAKPELLFLSHRIPYPPNKGDKIRSWNVLKHLTERFDVHLGAFVDDPADREHEAFLRTVCKDVCLLDMDKAARIPRLIKGFNSDRPLSIAMWEDRRMHDFTRGLFDRGGVEHVFVFSGQMAPYVLKHTSRRRMIMMDFVDIDSDKFRQYAAQSNWLKKIVYAREAKLLEQFEKQVARVVDASLFVSEAEADLFKSYAGSYAHTVYALNNGVDLDYFSADADFAPMRLEGAPSFVLTGAMDYKPNVDAATWMVKDILPRVRKTFADASFTIVGSSPNAEVLALDKKRGVTVTGRVADVRPYVAAADIAVAPIRIARGVQNKVLEAMAMARPVVATNHAFSGIHAEPGRDLQIADSADDFAAALVALMQDPERRKTLGMAARARMDAAYSWPSQMRRLDQIIDRHDANLRSATT
ncbi:TIGR03087 family PEP-CTERM/XrtA system glycosyltransferase [Pacificimonas sp. WHA3]|uniref:TIGR03087 family PEP-CTERM/XrtA system glycosyltransferase n=1 Tax=Pacificimonas pallii TaxID=2827236 RepID=A0ABS6SFB8_9SPHN|nr:TIGR03087 family PEP-CTERM/XrtA system glycosyltransferase [Pacificimonas pallii]MBV7257105.1 TIGR03087 family PEP-CTERM/XrtA system glycosyltransferase [Pacificimonas pallii]